MPTRPPVLGSTAGPSAIRAGPSSEASAATPIPFAVRPKNCRRVISSKISRFTSSMASLFRDGFIHIEDGAGYRRPGGQPPPIQLRIALRLAHSDQLDRRRLIAAVLRQFFARERKQHRAFLGLRFAVRGQAT